ncbi:uncharacterized protein LOC119775032 [Cyprinodon tularosa]|uniref:uncharacterized protein LOC119775032 n=1 Tax=Cyprinodon tularosa TaxID=77115 RepID=UPI0018E1E7E6|nr:uncharacterized protein LOC119775032 [Cyprinodon tularosa]
MNVPEKLNIVKTLKTCKRCLRKHEDDAGCINTYLCRNKDCKKGSFSDHHFLLCPKGELTRVGIDKPRRKNRLTEEQEKFIAGLSPELAEECRKAFSNVTASTRNTKCKVPGLMESHGLKKQHVILMLLEVTANAGQKIGTLFDLASDTNYITHQAAKRLNLEGENITLVVHGVGGMSVKVRTKRYLLKVRVKTPKGTVKAHQLICYGLSEIAKVHKVIQPLQLQKFFPDVDLEDLKRPDTIELLISHREGRLAPQRVKVVGDLVLWNSPLGMTVGGAHPDLCEDVDVAAHRFRRGLHAALGDIKKMYNSVWLEDLERHLHRFLWRDSSEEEIGEFAITRVNIGDRPAGCIAQVAMRETAKLPMFDSCKEERRILEEDCYVDDILTSDNDPELLHKHTKKVEEILQAGGFFLKPWVLSGQSGRQKMSLPSREKILTLPNQLKEDDNKALGVGYVGGG